MLVSANWVPFRSTPSPTVNVELRVAGGHLVKPDEPGPTVFFPGQVGLFAWADWTVGLDDRALLTGASYACAGTVLERNARLCGSVRLVGPRLAEGTTLFGSGQVVGEGRISAGTSPERWRVEGDVVVLGDVRVVQTEPWTPDLAKLEPGW